MILKRLIAISVVFALVAGTAFAVDLGGDVIGSVNFLEGNSKKDGNDESFPLGASAGMNRIRLEGSGENDDGTFGGWIRADQGGNFAGYAWWKPIDQLKLTIGGNGGDGFYGKEGVTGWMFYQTVSDTGVVTPGNVWGGGYSPFIFRSAFYGGFGDPALHLTISPIDILDINIAVPFWAGIDYDPDTNPGGRASSIFKRTVAQLDLKLDFGNIALTYVGAGNTLGYELDMDLTPQPGDKPKFDVKLGADAPTFFAYFGLTSIENLGIDVGIGFPLPVKNDDDKDMVITRSNPIAIGLGAKFTSGAFGIKARVVANLAGSVKVDTDNAPDPLKDAFGLTADILPFFSVSDNLTIFFSAGLGITGAKAENEDWIAKVGDIVVGPGQKSDAVVAWHINPYVQVGSEWGPKFLAGIKLWSNGVKGGANDGDKALVNWEVPVALIVGF